MERGGSQKFRKNAGVVYGWFPIDQVYCFAFGHESILDEPILLYQGPEKNEVMMGFFAANEVVKNVHWHREDDSRVVLGGYTAQRLKVAELWHGREEK